MTQVLVDRIIQKFQKSFFKYLRLAVGILLEELWLDCFQK